MFGKLKEKLKNALSVFSKKAEEEAKTVELPIPMRVPPREEPEFDADRIVAEKLIHKVKTDFAEEEKQKQREQFAGKYIKKEEKRENDYTREKTDGKREPKEEKKEIVEEKKESKKEQKEELPLTHSQAWELVLKYNSDPSDLNHYLESEAVMKALARKLGENEEYWGMLGLVHDLDWGLTKNYPENHLSQAPELLKKAGFDQKFIDIIISHGYGFDLPGLKEKRRSQKVEHALAASETVTGLVHAYALMRNGLEGMEAKGLEKKFKDKAFAAGIKREIIQECEQLGISLNDFLQLAIKAISEIKEQLHFGKKKEVPPEAAGEEVKEEKEEKLEIIDHSGKIIGTESREKIHREGLLHREVHIWIFDKKGEILFQRRAPGKDTFPNLLDASAAGHVDLGEDYLSAAVREMEEETGLKISSGDLIYLDDFQMKGLDPVTGRKNNALTRIYAYRYEGEAKDLRLEKGKATSLEFWPIKKIFNLNDKEKRNFIPTLFGEDYLAFFRKIEGLVRKRIPAGEVWITYFVHGSTTDNEENISSGWSDVGLSEKGIKQSIELIEQIKDKHFDIVFCSDLKRAVHSAELTFKNRVKIIQDKRLRECNYGKFNGKLSEIVEPMQEKCVSENFPGGESYEEVKNRIAEFLNYLYENYAGKHVAIVAHKAPQLALEVLLKNKSWNEAFAEDWRKRKAWQSGWDYVLKRPIEIEKAIETVEEHPEEKKSFFSKIFGKKGEQEKEESAYPKVTEIPVPEKFNPATQKYEPDLAKIQEISAEVSAVEEEKKGFFGKIKQTLTTKTISADKFDELFWDLEVTLLENNVSVEVIEKIKADLKQELVDKPLPRNVGAKIEETLQETLREILTFETIDLLSAVKKKEQKPYVIAFFGINGAGKTTSIAKLAHYLQKNKLSVVFAACDTFRAAAIQQLEEHAQNLGIKMIKHDYGSDAAAVAFDAIKYAEKNKIDVVMIDTAGRLHSNANLMSELEKIIRVTKPDLKLFVGESITGNDCIEQAKNFEEMVSVDGTILTKADVDEKGGAPLSIAYTLKKPILFMGVGQKYDDFEEFDREKMLKRLGF